MTVSELIRTKRTVRQFTDEPLSAEAIRAILNAAGGRKARRSRSTLTTTIQTVVEVFGYSTLGNSSHKQLKTDGFPSNRSI